MDNGRFQKISIPHQSHLFGIPRAKGGGGGSIELEIRGHGEILTVRLEFRRHVGGGGGVIYGISTGNRQEAIP